MRLLLAAALICAPCAPARAGSKASVPAIPPLPAPAAGLPTLEGFRRDMPRLLDHVAAEPVAWRSRQAVVQGVLARIAHPPEGLDPAVAAVLPKVMRAVQILARKDNGKAEFVGDVSELLYSVGKLADRGPTLEKAFSELEWLFGTYASDGSRRIL